MVKILRFWKVANRRTFAYEGELVASFERERAKLQRLALWLTADAGFAECCMNRALRECTAGASVSREWIPTWTRRMVICHAIELINSAGYRKLAQTDKFADSSLISFTESMSLDRVEEPKSFLDLPELDRLVFVICVLEGYSMHDCALLLGRTARDIIDSYKSLGGLANFRFGTWHINDMA